MEKEIENLLSAKAFIYCIKGSYYCLSNDIQKKIEDDDRLEEIFNKYIEIKKLGKETNWVFGYETRNGLKDVYNYLNNKAIKMEESERRRKYGNSIATNCCMNEYQKYLTNLGKENVKIIYEQFKDKNQVEKFLICKYRKNFIDLY